MNKRLLRGHPLLSAVATCAILSSSVFAQLCPLEPDVSVGKPMMNETVFALTVHDGNLMAAGRDSPVMRWDGEQWHAVGPLFESQYIGSDFFNGWVHAMTVYNGELIVGGHFALTDDALVLRVARWDAQVGAWQPLGEGLNERVFALTVYNGELIAGGVFTASGSTPLDRIARWDEATQSWQPLTASGDITGGSVRALHVHDDDLIVGGAFTHASGIEASGVARWDGETWHSFGDSLNVTSSFGGVRAMATHAGNLYLGGSSLSIEGISGSTNLVRWDGQMWEPVGGWGGSVNALMSWNGRLVVGTYSAGPFNAAVMQWDGTEWSMPGGGAPGSVN